MMNVEERPLYKLYVVGSPSAAVEFYSAAARELGINLEVEYHGCVIETLFSDGYGLMITDADVESLRIEIENNMAQAFYRAKFGKDWLEKVRCRALELLKENNWKDNLPL